MAGEGRKVAYIAFYNDQVSSSHDVRHERPPANPITLVEVPGCQAWGLVCWLERTKGTVRGGKDSVFVELQFVFNGRGVHSVCRYRRSRMRSQNNVDSEVTFAGIRYTASIRTRVRKTQASKQAALPVTIRDPHRSGKAGWFHGTGRVRREFDSVPEMSRCQLTGLHVV